uniref:Uncharacterized protein n=1 Tax=Anopheles maculatus TaxID=74869 RepID=A0A182SA51_9DIPT
MKPNSEEINSVGIDPADEGRDASEHIGHAEAARDTPRDNTVHSSTLNQRATRVSHAHTLTVRAERTDGRVEDTVSVGSGVTVAAISQGNDLGVQELQIVRDTDLTPTGSNGSTTGDEVRSKSDWLHSGSVRDEASRLHQRHIVGERVGVVARVVDDTGRAVSNASTVQQESTDHGDRVSGRTSDRAVSSGQHVAIVDDRATAEVRIARRAQRNLVRELVRSGILATNDTSGPFVVLGRQHCRVVVQISSISKVLVNSWTRSHCPVIHTIAESRNGQTDGQQNAKTEHFVEEV